jgi:hypothetical protein
MLGLSSPLVEKRTILFMIRKRMIGRRAYSESVAPSPRLQKLPSQDREWGDATSITSTETSSTDDAQPKQKTQRSKTEFITTILAQ